MLLSTVFVLRPMADVMLPMTLGNAVYTAVLQLIGAYDRDLVAWLHDAQGCHDASKKPSNCRTFWNTGLVLTVAPRSAAVPTAASCEMPSDSAG